MRCIFCLGEAPGLLFTEEHVFPEAIGGRFVIGSVCKSCNDQLGSKVDCRLSEHFAVQAKRDVLGLAGKSGRIPKLLERMTLAGKPGYEIVNKLDANGNPKHYLTPHVERTKKADGMESVLIAVDVSDRDRLPEMLNKMLSRAGQPTRPPEEILAQARVQCTPHPGLEKQFIVDDHDYKRCVLKIAYEMACHWLGEGYLEDPQAELLRRCILSDEPVSDEMAAQFFSKIDLHEDGGTGRFWDREEDSHLIILMPLPRNTGGIAAYVRIFKIFVATVLVSRCDSAELYPSFKGMFLANPVAGGQMRECTLPSEISRNRRNPCP